MERDPTSYNVCLTTCQEYSIRRDNKFDNVTLIYAGGEINALKLFLYFIFFYLNN